MSGFLRPALRPLALTTALATGGYIYYRYSTRIPPPTTFELALRTRGPDGKPAMATKTVSFLSPAVVEQKLTENAFHTSVTRPNGMKWKHSTAFLASNDPIEDAYGQAIIERDPLPDVPPGDLLFFAIMDGHSGVHTSRLLSKTLIPAVALELSTLFKPVPQDTPSTFQSIMSYFRSFVSSSSSASASVSTQPATFDADPTYVKLAIQTAFSNLDSEIITAPLKILKDLAKDPNLDLTQHPMAVASMLPALSGSCAILAMIDTARKDLYVACTGDCRAVAGYWDEDANGKGQWRVEVLSEDQTGRNPNELKRMQSEHPSDEASFVIQRGRVLGGLEPTRAFGDARYKWPQDVQEQLTQKLLAGSNVSFRGPPAGLKTPPYVTSQPVLTHRKLSLPDDNTVSTPIGSKSTLRFIVLATDGLWDALSSSEVVSLVGGHIEGLKGAVPKSELASRVRMTDDAAGIEGKGEKKPTTEQQKKSWAFVDENVGTHLIRNAMGGADAEQVRKMVSIPAPLSRRFRDDITVTVVWWEDDCPAEVKARL